MKKVIVNLVCFFFAGMTIFAQSKAIAVPVPKTVNMPSELDYVPISIQGIVQSDLRKYGDLKVVDRLNENMIKAEQKLSESVFYSDDDLLQIGNMTKARLIVVGKILYKPATSSFQLNFNINDVEKNEIKATANIDNCSLVTIENGDAIHELSYKLMSEYGIKLTETQKQELTKKSSSSTNNLSIEAQINVAKGMIAAQNGQNVEALSYYMKAKTQDKTFIDADKLMNQMTSVVTGGNFGETAKNLIKLRKDWIKLLEETAKFIADNEPMYDFVYDTYMEIDKIDYENEKLSIKFHYPAVFKEQSEINKKELMEKIIAAYNKIPESKDWGIDIDNFDTVYAGRYWDYKISLKFELFNSDKKCIASKEIVYNTSESLHPGRTSKYANESKQTTIELESDGKRPYKYEYKKLESGGYSMRWYKTSEIACFILSDIPVDNADTSTMYIKYRITSPRKNVSVYSEEQFSNYVDKCNEKARLAAEKKAVEERINESKRTCILSDDGKTVTGLKNKEVTQLVIPDGVTEIGYYAFSGCTSLTSITIPDSVTIIGNRAFSGCKSLTSITIPDSVTIIGNRAFSGCTSLTSITIPDSVTSIRGSAFSGCTSLTSITIPDSMTS
ncbi:MAG: leucine-rich repeat domain-containing protein, partial [Spirochaetales bacterium]|nr:leucine-rich repeat domain-containing protein [Spirochaetales bacterium]